RRDLRSDFVAAGDEEGIRSAVGQILGTNGASDRTPGEVPWRTEFGSLLYLLRHQKNDSVLAELARVYVVDALKRWDPRVVVTAVTITQEGKGNENVLSIHLRYDAISLNVPGNNVILSGVEQTIVL